MTYTAAETEPLAQRLVKDLPGLNINLARAWIKAESGANGNVLGTTHTGANGKAVLDKYPTQIAGIDAAAQRIKTLSYYKPFYKTITSGGNVRQQALALIASPWNHPGSPYYTKVFAAAGLLGGPIKSTGGGGVGLPNPIKTVTAPIAGATTNTGTSGPNIFGLADGTVITPAIVTQMMATLTAGGFFANDDPMGTGRQVTQALLNGLVGKQWNATLALQLQAEFDNAAKATGATYNPISGITDPIAGLTAGLGTIAKYLGALILLGLGVYLYSKGGGTGEAATA